MRVVGYMQGEAPGSAPAITRNELDFEIGNGGIALIIILSLVIVVLLVALIVIICKTRETIKSLQRRIDNKLTDDEAELVEQFLKLNDDSKAKITNILSAHTEEPKEPPKDGD